MWQPAKQAQLTPPSSSVIKLAWNPNLSCSSQETQRRDGERVDRATLAMSNEDLDGQELLAARTQLLEELQVQRYV